MRGHLCLSGPLCAVTSQVSNETHVKEEWKPVPTFCWVQTGSIWPVVNAQMIVSEIWHETRPAKFTSAHTKAELTFLSAQETFCCLVILGIMWWCLLQQPLVLRKDLCSRASSYSCERFCHAVVLSHCANSQLNLYTW